MKGQNQQTQEGFINSFGHPRKAELATMLLIGEATIEALAEAGYGRINVLEMARDIRNNVEGMQEFNFEWPRDVEVEVAKPERTQNVAAPTEETVVAPEVTAPDVAAPEVTAPDAVAPEVAPVAEETVIAPTEETVVTPEVAAQG